MLLHVLLFTAEGFFTGDVAYILKKMEQYNYFKISCIST